MKQCDTSDTTTPYSKYTISCLTTEELSILKEVYRKLYPQHSHVFDEIPLPNTIKKICHVFWNGYRVDSESNVNAKNCFVLASPSQAVRLLHSMIP